MKYSLGISNFLEEISSLSHSIVFLYFFALISEEGFLISPCYSLELCILMGIFLFLLCFSLPVVCIRCWHFVNQNGSILQITNSLRGLAHSHQVGPSDVL